MNNYSNRKNISIQLNIGGKQISLWIQSNVIYWFVHGLWLIFFIVRDIVSTYICINAYAFQFYYSLLAIYVDALSLINFFQKPLNHWFSLKQRNESALSSKVSLHWLNNRVAKLYLQVSLNVWYHVFMKWVWATFLMFNITATLR